MPARRLLLAAALLLAALALVIGVRTEENDHQATRPTVTSGPPPERATVVATVTPREGKPARVTARLGDLVMLEVPGPAPDSVVIVGYDEVQTVDPENPARFDFVADRAGLFPVRFSSTGRVAGVLVVRPLDRTP
jgi:hypothetical protein